MQTGLDAYHDNIVLVVKNIRGEGNCNHRRPDESEGEEIILLNAGNDNWSLWHFSFNTFKTMQAREL